MGLLLGLTLVVSAAAVLLGDRRPGLLVLLAGCVGALVVRVVLGDGVLAALGGVCGALVASIALEALAPVGRLLEPRGARTRAWEARGRERELAALERERRRQAREAQREGERLAA